MLSSIYYIANLNWLLNCWKMSSIFSPSDKVGCISMTSFIHIHTVKWYILLYLTNLNWLTDYYQPLIITQLQLKEHALWKALCKLMWLDLTKRWPVNYVECGVSGGWMLFYWTCKQKHGGFTNKLTVNYDSQGRITTVIRRQRKLRGSHNRI